MSNHTFRHDIREEAAEWLLKLQEPNLSPHVLLRWKKWQESPRNREAFNSLQLPYRAIRSVGRLDTTPRHATPPPTRTSLHDRSKPIPADRDIQLTTLNTRSRKQLPDHQPPIVTQEAAYWYIRSCDERTLSKSDRYLFLRWLKRSPDHIAEILKLAAMDGSTTGLLRSQRRIGPHDSDGVGLGASFDCALGVEAANPAKGGSTVRWRWVTIVAAVTLAALLALIGRSLSRDQTVTTGAGEWEHMTLPDGSVLHVGARTKLTVEFTDKRRIVELIRGEAVFDVAADTMRPFTVSTPLIDATAVGTEFSVSVDNGITMTVSEGTVKVAFPRNRSPAVSVNAGEQLMLASSATAEPIIEKVDPEQALAWASGCLRLDGVTVGQLINEFNRRHAVQIQVEQPEIAARQVFGHDCFRLDSPSQFARRLAELGALELKVDRSGKTTLFRLEER